MAYVTNLGENANIGTHWITLYSSNNKITYFDNFGAEHMSDEIIIGVIRVTLMLSSRYLTNLFSPNNFKDDLKQY